MKIESVPVDAIEIGARLRCLNEVAVNTLVESMKRLGQLQPISVYAPDNAAAHLVAGLHRLEAARRLGWENIDAVFVSCGDIDRELQEIAENLHRNELTALERDTQIARWVELVAAKVSDKLSETSSGDKGGRPGKASATAREIGVNERDVQRAVKVASISEEAKTAARNSGLDDNRSALLAAAKESTPEAQVAKISELAQAKINRPPRRAPSVDIPDVKEWEDVEAEQKRRLMQTWNGCSPAVQAWFREAVIDKPLMDRRFA